MTEEQWMTGKLHRSRPRRRSCCRRPVNTRLPQPTYLNITYTKTLNQPREPIGQSVTQSASQPGDLVLKTLKRRRESWLRQSLVGGLSLPSMRHILQRVTSQLHNIQLKQQDIFCCLHRSRRDDPHYLVHQHIVLVMAPKAAKTDKKQQAAKQKVGLTLPAGPHRARYKRTLNAPSGR